MWFFKDGHFDIFSQPSGMTLERLSESASGSVGQIHFGTVAKAINYAGVATALFSDALVVHAQSEQKSRISIQYHGVSSALPRVLIVAQAHAELELDEHFVGDANSERISIPTLEIVLATGAKLTHRRIQNDKGALIGQVSARLDRDASYTSTTLSVAGPITRQDTFVTLLGDGSQADISAVYLAGQDHEKRLSYSD